MNGPHVRSLHLDCGPDDTTGPPVAAARVVDVDGGTLECVGLLLLLRCHVQSATPGTLLRVRTQDPIAQIDLPAWCRLTGHTWLGPLPPPETNTGHSPGLSGPSGRTGFVYGVRVESSARRTHPRRPWRILPPTTGEDRARGLAASRTPALPWARQ